MVLTNKDVGDILGSVDKEKIVKKLDGRLYLTRYQFHKLKLLYDIQYIGSNVPKILCEKIKNALKKESISFSPDEKIYVKNMLGMTPDDINMYIYGTLNKNDKDKYIEIQRLLIGHDNHKCFVCHRMEYKFCYCHKHYDMYKPKIISNILNIMSGVKNIIYYLQLIQEKLITSMKSRDDIYKTLDVDCDNYRKLYYENIRNNTADNNVIKLIDMIDEPVSNEKKFVRLINKCHKNIAYIEKDNSDINHKNIYIHTIDNMNNMNLGKNIVDMMTKNKLNLVDKILYVYTSAIHKEDAENKIYDVINILNVKKVFVKEIETEAKLEQIYDIKMELIRKLYGSKYKIFGLCIDKYFDDNYYINNIESLTYDIYGELYVEYQYIPFIINIQKYDKIKMDKKVELEKNIKDIYCIFNGIKYIYINQTDNIEERIKFFLDGIIEKKIT